MELYVKHFSELTVKELYGILELRSAVFVVEQNCAYQDIDGLDENAYHMWFSDDDGIAAYLRILPPGSAVRRAGTWEDNLCQKAQRNWLADRSEGDNFCAGTLRSVQNNHRSPAVRQRIL